GSKTTLAQLRFHFRIRKLPMKTPASQANGPTGPVRAALAEVVETIAQRIPARAIYLFGSYARGEQRPESDIDLLVVVDDEAKQAPRRLASEAYASLVGTKLPVEIKVVRQGDFRRRSSWLSSVERAVQSEGLLLYGVAA
ncbi:MAG: nucleotidyltransferase domain-containing protein, partial [Chthoniobacterales bacterium]